MNDARTQRRLAAILAADVAGYSRMMGADEAGTLRAMREIWSERFNPLIAAHRGRVVKMMGDGALVEFASAVEAVTCALAIQSGMAERNTALPESQAILLRIGINLGDIVIDGDDIFGDGVNVAARLEGQAPLGGILVSDGVHAQITGKVPASFADAGLLSLKNISAPVRGWRWTSDAAPSGPREAAVTAVPSIAVLPFNNMSGDSDQEYFADGLVEDIITTLSKLEGLRVIARNSSFVYKGQTVDVREAGQQLGVRYVLEGSVRKSGNRIRITAQLIDAATGSHVWAERYDRSIDDIFALQDEITLVLATEMQVKLTEGAQARLHYTTTSNVEAWTHWVQGLGYYRKTVTEANLSAAFSCWSRALALDPDSAVLNAMIGFLQYADARFGWWEDRETAIAKGQDFVNRALALDPENPHVHSVAGLLFLARGRFDDAVESTRRAVQLGPGAADVASFACFVLAFAGHPAEAVVQGEKAKDLSPMYPGNYLGHLGNAYRLANRFDEAIAAFKGYHARSPGFGLSDLVIAHTETGRQELAREAARELLSLRRNFTVSAWEKTQFRADKDRLASDIQALLDAGLPME